MRFLLATWEGGGVPPELGVAPEEDFLDVFLCGPADRFAADTLEALDRRPVDALIADMTIFGAIIAGEVRGLPCAVLVLNISMRPTPRIPPIGPRFLPPNGVTGRLRDLAVEVAANDVAVDLESVAS